MQKEHEFELIRKLIADHSLAMVFSTKSPLEYSLLPLRLDTDDQGNFLCIGHMAKANLHWKELVSNRRVRMVFNGPNGYISPSWYVPSVANVPTWNYAVIQVTGEFTLVEDTNIAFKDLENFVDHFEPRYSSDWKLPKEEPAISRMSENIVCFRIINLRFQTRFKLSLQQSPENRLRVIKKLREVECSLLANFMELT